MRARFASLVHRFAFRGRLRSASRYEAFARAERSSMLDLIVAARETESTERAARYLAHAVDEARHAEVFARRASRLRASELEPQVRVYADTDALFTRLGEVGFVAFVHHGERRGRSQFEAHVRAFDASGASKDGRILRAVLRDEARHEAYTRDLLGDLAGGDAAARRALRRARAWEAWRTFRRLGRSLVAPLFGVAMALVYLAFAPLAWPLRSRGSEGAWRSARAHELGRSERGAE